MSNKGKKYLTKFTPKQQKFIDQYTSKFGLLSARDRDWETKFASVLIDKFLLLW